MHSWLAEPTTCRSAFCHGNKIPQAINFKEERFILAYGSRSFSPWSLGSAAFGFVARQSTIVGNTWWSRDAHLMVAEKQKERVEGAGLPTSPSKAPSKLTASH
jgi:hypothetical protein